MKIQNSYYQFNIRFLKKGALLWNFNCYILFILVWAGISESLRAQQNIDSLLSVIKSMPADSVKIRKAQDLAISLMRSGDTERSRSILHIAGDAAIKTGRVNDLLDTGFFRSYSYYVESNLDSALAITRRLAKRYKENNNLLGVAKAINMEANIVSDQGDFDLAIRQYKKALDISARVPNKVMMSNIYNNIGVSYNILGKNDSAIVNYKRSVELRKQIGQEERLLSNYINLSELYLDQSLLDSAVVYGYKGLRLAEKYDNLNGRLNSYLNLARARQLQHNLEDAKSLNHTIFAVASKNDNKWFLTEAANNLGVIFNNTNQLDSAWYYLNIAVETSREQEWDLLQINALNNMARYFNLVNEPLNAIESAEKAHKLAKATEQNEGIIESAIQLADAYIKNNEIRKASNYLGATYERIKKSEHSRALLSYYPVKIKLDSLSGNMQSLMRTFRRYIAFKDSLLNKQKLQIVNRISQEYDAEKRELKIANQQQLLKLEQQANSRKTWFISGLVMTIILISFIVYKLYKLYVQNKNLAAKNAMLINEQNHRIKNNLQMISSLLSLQANKSDSKGKNYMLESSRRVQAIALLHRRLYNGNDKNVVNKVPLKQYISELVEDILYASGKDNIPVKLDLENVQVDVNKAVHLALILNELVINSLKYVFSKKQLNGEQINISLKFKNGTYEFVYKDFGGDFKKSEFLKSGSMGSEIICSQSKHLGENYEIKEENGFFYRVLF